MRYMGEPYIYTTCVELLHLHSRQSTLRQVAANISRVMAVSVQALIALIYSTTSYGS